MAGRSYPLAFGLLLVGGFCIEQGAKSFKSGLSSASSSTGSGPGAALLVAGPTPAGRQSNKQLVAYFQSRGLTKIAGAGIVGNLQQESSLDPNAAGGGLAQWIGSRGAALQAFAAAHGMTASNETAQLEFLMNELQSQYPALVGQLNRASSPGLAATLFEQTYERAGIPALSNRIAYANAAYAA